MQKKMTEIAGRTHIAVELESTNIPAFDLYSDSAPYGNPRQGPQTLVGTKIVIIHAHKIYNDEKQNFIDVDYYDMAKNQGFLYARLPKDLVVKIMTKKESAPIMKNYHEHIMKNIRNYLMFPHLIGSDPEIFAEDESGVVVPAFNFLGSKANPTTAPMYEHHEIRNGLNNCYWDGFQAEFDTTAKECMGWHADSIQNGLKGVYLALKKYNPNAKLSIKTVMDIPRPLLLESAPEHVEFGCMPSQNIYDMQGRKIPGRDEMIRPAGGHIHFGCGKLEKEQVEKVVKTLDAILGVAAVSLFEKYDDPRRRELYGLAGEYRLPPHGLEYRTLSNAWLIHPLFANLIFDLARGVFAFGLEGLLEYWNGNVEETVKCINTCDVKLAREILSRNETTLTSILSFKYGTAINKTAFRMIMEGGHNFIKSEDVAKNWYLDGGWKTHCGNPGNYVASVHEQLAAEHIKLMDAKKTS